MINCNEWPMAMTKQDDFIEGKVRSSLRCMPADESSSRLAPLSSPETLSS